jgi:hypothetical protein
MILLSRTFCSTLRLRVFVNVDPEFIRSISHTVYAMLYASSISPNSFSHFRPVAASLTLNFPA